MRRIGCSGSCCDNSGPAGPKLIIVNPDTIVGWHRAGVRLCRRWRSRGRGGRPRIRGGNSRPDPAPGTRESGLGCSQNPRRTPDARLRGLRKGRGTIFTAYGAPGRSGQNVAWVSSFAITAKPSSAWTCSRCRRRRSEWLYCLFVIDHGRHRILHFNVTRHPSADSVVQQ